jgi:hypothetical protein
MSRPTTSADRTVIAAILAAVLGWSGVVAIGLQLGANGALGFDLQLLIEAARDLAAGRTPYAADLLGGGAPVSTDLFYSYPPPVGQALIPFTPLSLVPMLVLWDALAVVGLLIVVARLRRILAPDRPAIAVLAVTAAAAPLTLPFAVGLLFGNLDVFFPLMYGTMLLASLAATPRSTALAGAALALASLKIHPASLGLWFAVRAVVDRGSGAARVVVAAVAAGVTILIVSIGLGGVERWVEYGAVVRAGTDAVIVDPRNAGPAALLVGASGGDDALARAIHIGVGVAAVASTVLAAWRRRDPLEGFAWATAASLATLPVTWYHYPSALLPVAIAAWLRATPDARRRVALALIAAEVMAAAALVALPLLWVAIGCVILATRWSRPDAMTASVRSAAPARGAG